MDMTLDALIGLLLAPYEADGAAPRRILASVPRAPIGETSATTLSLMIHELATNSVKYGALSVEVGTIRIEGDEQDECIVLTWIEQDGPAVAAPVGRGGFGSRLIAQGVTRTARRLHRLRLEERRRDRQAEHEQGAVGEVAASWPGSRRTGTSAAGGGWRRQPSEFKRCPTSSSATFPLSKT